MRRMTMLAVVCAAALALYFTGCTKNQPPAAPEISGPTLGRPGSILSYTVTTTDPEGQSVEYEVLWSDTSTAEWSESCASGQQVTYAHTFSDSGVYHVKVKARDAQSAESGWSDSLLVSIEIRPPQQPGAPTGPTACTTGVAYTFTATTTDPFGDSVSYQFDWGDAVGNWGSPVASGSPYTTPHVFDSAAAFNVMVRARNAGGAMSGWSDPLVVTVEQGQGGPATGLTVSAATDSTVKLAWTAPARGIPTNYKVYFRAVDSINFVVTGTPDTPGMTHNPGGATGHYTVSSVYGSQEYCGTDTVSTIPVHTTAVTLSDLNAMGIPGYGWDRTTGIGATYSMFDSSIADRVDFYVTDRAAGYGDSLRIASSSTGPTDAGGGVPGGRWHSIGFTNPLVDPQSPLPRYRATDYHIMTLITSQPCYVGYYSVDDSTKHYALVQVDSLDIASGKALVESWYQLVPKLRLIRH